MRIISNEHEYQAIDVGIDTIIDKQKNYPNNVFKQDFKYFLFITYDCIFSPTLFDFFGKMVQFLQANQEDKFLLSSISPDAKSYFKYDGLFALLETNITDTEAMYNEGLEYNLAKEYEYDSLGFIPDIYLFTSYTYNWAIYADRDWEIGVCAFKDKKEMELFESIFGYCRDELVPVNGLFPLEEISEYCYYLCEHNIHTTEDAKKKFRESFIKNYTNKA